MLTCFELNTFTDQLCDLTRQMPGLDRVREATELLDLIEEIPRRFLMEWRAAAVADLHYLGGMSLREIAEAGGRSKQGADQWLQRYGPSHYVSLLSEEGQIRAVPFAVEGQQTKKKIQQCRAAGRRIVPAVENVYNPATGDVRDGTNLAALWRMLDADAD